MKNRNIVLGGIFLLIGLVLMKVALEPHEMMFADPNALNVMTYPRILIGIWIAASILYTFSKKDENDWYDFNKAKFQLLKVLLSIMFYIFTFEYLGLLASTVLFLGIFFWIMNYRNPRIAIPIALICAFGTWFVFEYLLSIPMPRPIFLDMF